MLRLSGNTENKFPKTNPYTRNQPHLIKKFKQSENYTKLQHFTALWNTEMKIPKNYPYSRNQPPLIKKFLKSEKSRKLWDNEKFKIPPEGC